MPFILLYAAKYTLQDVHVISRINSGQWHSWNKRLGQVEAWVVRFVRSLRLEKYSFNIDNMQVVKHRLGPLGKGPAAARKNITHFVDNDLDNLWGIQNDSAHSIQGLIHYTATNRQGTSRDWDDHAMGMLFEADSWYRVAEYFDLPYLDQWEFLESKTPPVQPPWNVRIDLLTNTLARRSDEQAVAVMDAEDDKQPRKSARPRTPKKRMASAEDDKEHMAAASAGPEADTTEADGAQESPAAVLHKRPSSIAEEGRPSNDELMFLVQQGKEQIQQLGREMIALRQEMRASVPPPPKWGQWASASSQSASWHERKLQRAIKHQKQRGQSSSSTAERRLDVVMCSWCGKNQPGVFCPDSYCRPCCRWGGAPCNQHQD